MKKPTKTTSSPTPTNPEQAIVVAGERVSLATVHSSDLPIMFQGINTPEIAMWVGRYQAISWKEEQKWFEEVATKNPHFFAIRLNKENKTIGAVWFNRYSERDRNGEIGISLYNKELLGKWYGSEAMKLFLKYAFEVVGCHKVWLTVNAENMRWIRSYESCGFQQVGKIREDRWTPDGYKDVIIMDLLRSEWKKK